MINYGTKEIERRAIEMFLFNHMGDVSVRI